MTRPTAQTEASTTTTAMTAKAATNGQGADGTPFGSAATNESQSPSES